MSSMRGRDRREEGINDDDHGSASVVGEPYLESPTWLVGMQEMKRWMYIFASMAWPTGLGT
jgi:hypothetical protein